MISVCLATYNGAKFLERQIQSIIIQLKEDDEIVISDDGSSDETKQIIAGFLDDRIKFFENTSYRGPVHNFENAIVHARGDIIFLADQDDIWMENKINRHLKHHEEFDLVISDAIVIDEQSQVLFESFFEARGSGRGLLKNIISNSYIGCCMSFTKKITKAAVPFPDNIHMHDWWIGLVAEVKGKIHFLQEPLMYYIRHDNNASPTLDKSGYSFIKKLKNRYQLILCLFLIMFKEI
jgi:glycosyltransferase involved in cell wall biosynthesis